MNIYLVERTDRYDYDEYDAVVVVAKSPAAAKKINPRSGIKDNNLPSYWMPDKLKVSLIGKAGKGQTEGAVLSSFNAG